MPIISAKEAEALNIPRGKWFIHTILIPLFAGERPIQKKEAIKWLKAHDYEYRRYRSTANYHRFNQAPEIINARYYTQRLPNGVDLVFEKY
jgi:hypothetical protein